MTSDEPWLTDDEQYDARLVQLHRDVASLLADLGDDPDAVADALRAENICGGIGGDDCPIAQLMIRRFPDPVPGFGNCQWFVETTDVLLVSRFGAHRQYQVAETPVPVSDFIRAYDAYDRAYADLSNRGDAEISGAL